MSLKAFVEELKAELEEAKLHSQRPTREGPEAEKLAVVKSAARKVAGSRKGARNVDIRVARGGLKFAQKLARAGKVKQRAQDKGLDPVYRAAQEKIAKKKKEGQQALKYAYEHPSARKTGKPGHAGSAVAQGSQPGGADAPASAGLADVTTAKRSKSKKAETGKLRGQVGRIEKTAKPKKLKRIKKSDPLASMAIKRAAADAAKAKPSENPKRPEKRGKEYIF